MKRLVWLAMVVVLAFATLPARAQDFALPGVAADAQAYSDTLTKRHPAGGTPSLRQAAEARAAAATVKKDWAGAVAALEERVSLGDATAQQWLDLATAQMRTAPPNPKRALAAAWESFGLADTGAPEIPSLQAMADALRALKLPDQAAQALEQVVQRAPDDAGAKQALAEARRAAGMVVRRVNTDSESDPPQACIALSVKIAQGGDFHPQDWVRLDAGSTAAVTMQADQLCIAGLAAGQRVHVVLRAGLPGQDGVNLTHDVPLDIAMPNRRPLIALDSRLFVLPRGQAPKLDLTTINVSSVALKLTRLTERNTVPLVRNNALGLPLDASSQRDAVSDIGSVVWQGRASIPGSQPNTLTHTALPIPDALQGPGLYALDVTADDGTPNVDGAVQMLLRTDLAPTVWRGSDGLTMQLRSYADAQLRPGVRTVLLAHDNDVLGETVTDAQGVARFARPLLQGTGPLAPAAVQLFAPDGDFAILQLDTAAFDLSDRGVSGAAQPGPLDAFLWLDRGIYRPGETVRLMAMLRDNAGHPADVPAEITIRRPNGQVFARSTPARGAEATVYDPIALSLSAPAGTWTVELRADPAADPIATTSFRVDAFVPDRMAVEAGPAPAVLQPGQTANLPVTGRYLYGAPGANLTLTANLSLEIDPTPFPSLQDWQIGQDGEAYAPQKIDLDAPDTDANGHSTIPLRIDHLPDTTQALHAVVDVELNDPSGHSVRTSVTIPVRGSNPFIAIKPAFATGTIDDGAEAAFDVVAVQPDGTRMTMPAHLRLVREAPSWRIVRDGQLARYETVWHDEPIEAHDVTLAADAPLHFARKLGFGRYRLEVAQAGGMAISSIRMHSGWTSSDAPDVPDRVDVSASRQSVAPGEQARIHIAAPFEGEATLLVLSDRVHSIQTLHVPAGGTDVDVTADAAWGPGAYIAVHVFRGGSGQAGAARPNRAIGLVWLGIDPAPRTLPLSIDAASLYTPRGPVTIPVHTAPGAWVSLAAVDEGILRLTQFTSPDPAAHFLGRRALGIDIRDDWGRLIAPADGAATLLRQGGDEAGQALPSVPQHTVTLFTPPMQADSTGLVRIPLDWPDFNGQVRLMAVGWQDTKIGAASKDVLVRDALVAEPLLPRFLAPGDQARMAVLLNDLDLPAGDAAVKVSVDGPLALAGPNLLGATLQPGQQVVATTLLRATGVGTGGIHLDVTGPSGFHIQRDTTILIRPSRPAVTSVAASAVPPGGTAPLPVVAAAYLPGSWTATATFGAPVRYDVGALVAALADYPLSCLEQATSRGLPLALLPGADAGALGTAVATVLDRQRYDGGFALWSAGGDAEPWLSAYAMEFLLRAQKAGATVPEGALKDGLKFLADAAGNDPDSPIDYAAQAYRLYVLALAGQGQPGLARVLAEKLDQLPTPLAKAQLGAALALAHDTPRAEAAFGEALATKRDWWQDDYGSTVRDTAAVTVLLKESGLLPDRLAGLSATLPGADLDTASLSTQEQAWLAAAGAVLGRNGRPARVEVNGAALAPAIVVHTALTGPATVKNLGDQAVWQSVSLRGVPATALPASRAGMRISRRFFNLDGTPLDLDHLKQNTNFVLLLEGQADDKQDHRVMVLQGLPAGWEIAGRFSEGKVAGMDWLGELTATDAQPATDDRFAASMTLSEDAPSFRIAVRLRAVTPGDYEIPGAELSDMYRPTVYARQTANRIKVLAPE